MRPVPSGWSLFYRVVRRIPRGRVATYGQVALAAGTPRAARQVGYALAALRGTVNDVPWQRVLGARPRGMAAVSILDAVGAAVQQRLLEEEGVAFDERGRVSLERFGWTGAARHHPERAAAAVMLSPAEYDRLTERERFVGDVAAGIDDASAGCLISLDESRVRLTRRHKKARR